MIQCSKGGTDSNDGNTAQKEEQIRNYNIADFI